MKRLFSLQILFIAVIISAITILSVPPSPSSAAATTASPRRPFPQHVNGAPNTIRPNHRPQSQLDDDVRAAYDHWKANYLKTVSGTSPAQYRVAHSLANPAETVSEGQGYGMVIVALMAGYDPDAQTIFDGLWRFARAHPSTIDPRLMAWKIPETSGDTDSAFDGDADMAYGLLLADAQWGSTGAINYAADARTLITAIRESTIGADSHLPLLGDWVADSDPPYNQYTPRSSDFMPAHFRAFGTFTGDATWSAVISATQTAITQMQDTYSPNTGLLPDFMVPHSDSDHTLQPAPPNFLEGAHDGEYDYNAGRDPWRIGTDAVLNGDAVSRAQAQKIANWIVAATGGNAAAIKAGYHLDGTFYGDYFTTFFAAPFGVALMTTPANQQFLNAVYDSVFDTYEDYYEDSVTLLAMLVMTGNYWQPDNISTATTADFPRLGMWWPNPWEQSLDDIARYSWVTLDDDAASFIPSLKTRNPNLLALNSTNACELDFDPAASPAENAHVANIPAEWFLTQVGTTLTADVNATDTLFHVANMSVSDGETDYPLFVVGDAVVIEGESARVTAVDESAKTLTVQRGYIRPAAAHTAGTRIAAHITFWPDSWVLNLSTMSPTAVVSSTIGAERWGDYNARVGAALLSNPAWDGLLIDRADPNESWLVGGSTARTIDPDQSNTLLTDYTAFDVAWNAGLRQYEQQLRSLVGDDKIIFVNWGMQNYDLLNGNNYEGFPLDNGESYRGTWHQTMFGTLPDVGDYFSWMENAQSPNITMIETYEDDGAPDATGDGSYNNPCANPNFTPNYRKMRFGLTTALLNDGYYAYEMNTNGHGALCLMWFDEYDNAGAQRGYLGQPLGAATRTGNVSLGSDMLTGGNFESQADLDAWDLWADTGYAATAAIDTTAAPVGSAAVKVDVTQTQGTDWQVSLSFAPVSVISGTEYTLSFWAKADRSRNLTAWAQQSADPWESYFNIDTIALTTDWQYFEIPVIAAGTDATAEFSFGFGESLGTVWLDDVRLQTGNRDVWRRDFSGGISLVNATNVTQTVPLNGTFRKINGTQDPAVNDGSLVSEVEIPPRDGIILLRNFLEWVYLPLILKTGG